jgi:hypothetical protein
MKKLFNQKKKLARQDLETGFLLDRLIEERWGFSYSQVDCDESIDTLDYGIGNLDFESFVAKMDEYRAKVDNGDLKLNA